MKKVSLILATLFLISVLTGCGVSEKAQEKAAEKVIENALGGEAKVKIDGDKYTYEDKDGNKMEFGGTEWPSDKAATFIPKFSKGSIIASSLVANVYLINVEAVEKADYEDYLKEIKEKGFTEQTIMTNADGYYQYQALDTNGNSIIISYESDGKMLQIMGTAAVGK